MLSHPIKNYLKILYRYYSLQEPMQIRRDNLEDALIHYRLLRDIEEEMAWIDDKELLINSNDFGSSSHSVQALQNKHQVCCTLNRNPV